ncbi:MAG: single-stranded DNA-binding protein [Dethiobacter sp.]|jgi:single-strand DNA-binding protein|nr:single-stranded DNA-binding protein [Dethiobacter sp.]
MLNRIVLIGRLTKDPELRYTPGEGTPVAGFTLAVNRRFMKDGKREADFVPIVVWRNQAENCAKYIGKGSLVAVDGRLQIRSYEDREGQRRTIAEVVAESVQFLESRRDDMGAPEDIGEDDVPF